ncbi:MAG: hypothetical protein ABIS50_02780 [Luteolibacter sp.]|uniref:hypothetical protein n=1 Tax=Luteolibacter sp. TaxID=1962973 RepID=UPI003263FEC8
MKIHWLSACLALGFVAESKAAGFQLTDQKAAIQSSAVTEASGLAVSAKDDHFLWTLNDSGGTPDLHLLNPDGADRGKVTVTNAKNIDWEDIASFTLDGKPYLLIADTGDNKSVRKSCTIHIVREPKLPADGQKIEGTVAADWHIDFTYEGGPRDCEAVAVDSINQKIILISKRTTPPEVYELPLRALEKKGLLIVKEIGQTAVESPVTLPFYSQPVGLDITRDDSLAAVVTYYGVFLFPRKSDETWADAFSHKPDLLAPHGLHQAESVAFSNDGKTIYVVSEGRNSPIKIYQR